ncbi:MAG: hypothetical protein M1818_004772 [Claussenomyces sp. TS43310]|nr:MAG: hypothetical protein M1818_004772 [Claussenomyces sp. TS43310]
MAACEGQKEGSSKDLGVEEADLQTSQGFMHKTGILPILTRADQTILHVQRCFSSPSGTDTLLMNVGYLSLMGSSILSAKLPAADANVQHLDSKGRHTSFLGILFDKMLSRHPPRVLGRTAQVLVDDFRNFGRLWRIFAIYQAIRNLCSRNVHSKMLLGIAWAQTLADLGYQVLENGAYISGKGILMWNERQQSRAWIWSSRFLGLVVVLDLFKVLWEGYSSSPNEAIVEKRTIGWPQVQIGEVLVNLIYLPLIGDYAVEKSKLSQFWVGFLGSAAGGLKFIKLWNNSV